MLEIAAGVFIALVAILALPEIIKTIVNVLLGAWMIVKPILGLLFFSAFIWESVSNLSKEPKNLRWFGLVLVTSVQSFVKFVKSDV